MNAHRQAARSPGRSTARRRALPLLSLLLILVACSGPRALTPTPRIPVTVIPTAIGTAAVAGTVTVLPATSTRMIGTPIGTTTRTVAPPGGEIEASGGWGGAGSLAQVRSGHTATLLPNGRLLIVGGEGGPGGANSLASAEVYDPRTNTWSYGPTLNLGRVAHTTTRLSTDEVLVVGGDTVQPDQPAAPTNSVELFDPATNSWRPGAAAALGRGDHTATILPDGRVLVVGGEALEPSTGQRRALASAEVYDPRTNRWAVVEDLGRPRVGHTATVLPDGRVVVSGGETPAVNGQREVTSGVEVFDPATGRWSLSGDLTTGRSGHTATLLPDGRVLVVGGQTTETRGGRVRLVGVAAAIPSATAEVFDPQSGSWRPVASLGTARVGHSATLLPGGQLLVAGGYALDGDRPLASAERYDVAANSWAAFPLPIARAGHTATLLADGSTILVGGKAGPDSYVEQVDRYAARGTPLATPMAPAQPTPTVAPSASAQPVPTATPVPPTQPAVVPTATRPPATPTPRPPTSTPTVRPTSPPIAIPPTEPPAPPTNTPTLPTATSAPPTSTPILPKFEPTEPPAPPTNTPTVVVAPTAPPTVPPRPPTPTATPLPARPGTVFGIVQGCYAGACNPLTGVLVSTAGLSTRTSQGSYALSNVPSGTVTVTVSGAVSGSKTVTVPAGGRIDVSFTLECKDPVACGFKP